MPEIRKQPRRKVCGKGRKQTDGADVLFVSSFMVTRDRKVFPVRLHCLDDCLFAHKYEYTKHLPAFGSAPVLRIRQ